MSTIADTLADLDHRIAETEDRIAMLATRNTEESVVLLLSAMETLRGLRTFKGRLEALHAANGSE